MPDAAKARLSYIDWTRGLACLLMFQTHCYDAWLSPAARQSRFFMYSQLGGTFPAPLFLFLAGVSFALVTEKLRQKNLAPAEIARKTIVRGAEIFGYGVLFRLLAYVVAWGWAPASDLLRVDILNTIGLSMILMGVVCWLVLTMLSMLSNSRTSMWEQPPSAVRAGEVRLPAPSQSSGRPSGRLALIFTALVVALLISLLTPPLWTTWRPTWLPWPLESYIDGVHNLGIPQPGLFPIFPWTGFAFAGLALGFILQTPWVRAKESKALLAVGVAGGVLILFARWLDAQPRQLYAVYDYWHTSPSFFLIRAGMMLVILAAGYVWCRWGLPRKSPVKNGNAERGFSPFIELGQASLLVYWVHLELVYGRLSILPKRKMGIPSASAGLLIISLAMIALAYYRTKTKGRGLNVFARLGPVPATVGRTTGRIVEG